LQIAAAIVVPPRCVAPSPSCVVRPPTSPLCVPVLILESQTVVALAAATVKTSLVVVSLVGTSLIVVALVVIALVEVVAVSIAEAVRVTIVITTAATVIVVPTKEYP